MADGLIYSYIYTIIWYIILIKILYFQYRNFRRFRLGCSIFKEYLFRIKERALINALKINPVYIKIISSTFLVRQFVSLKYFI